MPHIQSSNTRSQPSDQTIFTFVRQRSHGFTLIELLVAVSILAIVATIGLSVYTSAQTVGRDARRRQDLRSMTEALELFYQEQVPHAYPVANGDASTVLVTPLVPTYLNQIPFPPSSDTAYQYRYTGTAASYELCVGVENSHAPQTEGVNNVRGNCTAGSTGLYLHMTSP